MTTYTLGIAVDDTDNVGVAVARRDTGRAAVQLDAAFAVRQLTLAATLRDAVDQVAQREGGPADRVSICHPSGWAAFELDLLTQAVRASEVRVDAYVGDCPPSADLLERATRAALRHETSVF